MNFSVTRLLRALKWLGIVGGLGLMAVLQGCGEGATFSNEVRPGGTVIVALKKAEAGEFLSAAAVDAKFTDVNSVERHIKVRNIIRIYADPTSDFGYGNYHSVDTSGCTTDYDRTLYIGQWVAIVDFVNNSNGVAITGVADGAGTLRFYDANTQNQKGYDHNVSMIMTNDPPVIPQQHNLGQFERHAKPQRVLAITTDDIGLWRTTYGNTTAVIAGAKFVVNYTGLDSFSTGVTEPNLRVVKLSNDPNLEMMVSRTGAGNTGDLTIFLSNPHGFKSVTDQVGINTRFGELRSLERDLSSAVVTYLMESYPSSGVNAGNYTNYFNLTESTYYDVDGNALANLNATMDFVN